MKHKSANKKSVYVSIIGACILSGCAIFAPKPPECQGQFKPVNAALEKDSLLETKIKVVRCNEESLHGYQG
jgi:hypothetical protein